jgi:hypothetical protein
MRLDPFQAVLGLVCAIVLASVGEASRPEDRLPTRRMCFPKPSPHPCSQDNRGIFCSQVLSGCAMVIGMWAGPPKWLGFFLIIWPIVSCFCFACVPNPCVRSEKMQRMKFGSVSSL